jgi:proteasome accessory factor C
LLALLPHLRQGETVSLADLAAAVGCTASDVASDLATLTMCGVPPFTPLDLIDLEIVGDHVTVHMDPPGMGHPLRLTAPEARALGAALDAAGYPSESPLRAKVLEAAADDVPADELERTVRAGAAPGGMADMSSTLAVAADEHEKIEVTYLTGSTGRISQRVVHPWALVNRLSTWYLIGFCEGAGEERVFRLDRMSAVTPLNEPFDPPTHVPTSVTPDTGRLGIAEVVFARGAAIPDERAWPGSIITPSADGSTTVRVPYQSPSWIARRVVSRLGDAVVTAPAEVRDAVRELALALIAENR